MSSPVHVMRTVTGQWGRNPVPVIKTWPREALMMGPVGLTGGAGGCSPCASVGMRYSDRLLVTPVAVRALRESRRSAIPSTLFHLIPTPGRRQVPGRVSGPKPGGQCGTPIPPPRRQNGAIVVGWLGLSHDEGAGVAPQPAARAVGIGAVVGRGDVQRARGAVG